ncbi:MAG: type II secretion system protein [Methylacidiphilales bacterium]|nr:type II secretion system protein [Candidatus Methylacidiphilales bacterium]
MKQGGFTFIELMVTLAILALLATIAYPTLALKLKRQKEQELKNAIHRIQQAIDLYRTTCKANLIDADPQLQCNPPTLTSLTEGIAHKSELNVKYYFISAIPTDPFTKTDTKDTNYGWNIKAFVKQADSSKGVIGVSSKSEAIGTNGIPYSQW